MAASASASPSVSPSSSPSLSPSASPSLSPSKSPSVSPSPSPSPMPAAALTYSMHKRTRVGKLRMNFVQVTFGGANEYYPSGGIPLTNGGMGCTSNPYAVIVLEDDAAGYQYQWDRSANKLRLFYSATGAVNAELGLINLASTITLELLVIGP